MTDLKVAGVQMDIQIGEVDANLKKMSTLVRETSANGAQLTVFPECTTTGYCFDSMDEAMRVAEPLDGPTADRVQELCDEFESWIVFGLLELSGAEIFNTVVLMDPTGIVGSYRKVHLPLLGVDRFVSPGDRGFSLVELPEVRIGMNICYDCSFPESARVLAILGADLIILPTNWPPTSGITADVIPPARALENHVYFMAINRIGVERGFEFIGKSRICDPEGKTLASADHRAHEIIYADIDVNFAREKHRINVPGKHEVHRMQDRRPELYRKVVDPG